MRWNERRHAEADGCFIARYTGGGVRVILDLGYFKLNCEETFIRTYFQLVHVALTGETNSASYPHNIIFLYKQKACATHPKQHRQHCFENKDGVQIIKDQLGATFDFAEYAYQASHCFVS